MKRADWLLHSTEHNHMAQRVHRASPHIPTYASPMLPFITLLRTLLFLLCITAAAPLYAMPMPSHAWIQFDFPAYTSLHDCASVVSDPQTEQKECLSTLQFFQELSTDPDLRDTEKKPFGFYGGHPLLFRQASVLHCGDKGCFELSDRPLGPPELIMWAPHPIIHNSSLKYRLPDSIASLPHQLRLISFDRTWQSKPFGTFWAHNYMLVRFDHAHPGKLLVTQDWQRTLGDAGNYRQVLDDSLFILMLWAVLLLPALLTALLLAIACKLPRLQKTRLCRAQHWRTSGYALAAFGLSLLLLLWLFYAFTHALHLGDEQAALLILVLFIASVPLEARWLSRRKGIQSGDALRLVTLINTGFVLFTILFILGVYWCFDGF